jgi:hypothetical protein
MLRAVEASESSIEPSIDEVIDVVAMAYDQVKLARRYLVSIPKGSDAALRLQYAEAELVRAKVALDAIDRSAPSAVPPVAPTMINGAILGIDRRFGDEHGI